MATAKEIFQKGEKMNKVAALYERGATEGERNAAKAILERDYPQYFLTDEELLAELIG